MKSCYIICRTKQVILYLTYVLKCGDFSPTFHRGSTMTFVGVAIALDLYKRHGIHG